MVYVSANNKVLQVLFVYGLNFAYNASYSTENSSTISLERNNNYNYINTGSDGTLYSSFDNNTTLGYIWIITKFYILYYGIVFR
jgi:hypothetical protein